jgi:hypothetical protein
MATTAQAAEIIGYEGWITIMLAGITVLVTLLGIGLAVAAIFGYSGVKEAARDAAEKAAERVIRENKDKWFKDNGLGLELPVAESQTADASSNSVEPVSRPYPGEEVPNASSREDAGRDNPPTPKSTSS